MKIVPYQNHNNWKGLGNLLHYLLGLFKKYWNFSKVLKNMLFSKYLKNTVEPYKILLITLQKY